MKCVICKSGDAAPGTTTVVLEPGRCAVVFRDVPAAICRNCGEAYVNDTVASSLLARAEQAVANGPSWRLSASPRDSGCRATTSVGAENTSAIYSVLEDRGQRQEARS